MQMVIRYLCIICFYWVKFYNPEKSIKQKRPKIRKIPKSGILPVPRVPDNGSYTVFKNYIFKNNDSHKQYFWLFHLPYNWFILTSNAMQVNKQYFWFSDSVYSCTEFLVFLLWSKQHRIDHAKSMNLPNLTR